MRSASARRAYRAFIPWSGSNSRRANQCRVSDRHSDRRFRPSTPWHSFSFSSRSRSISPSCFGACRRSFGGPSGDGSAGCVRPSRSFCWRRMPRRSWQYRWWGGSALFSNTAAFYLFDVILFPWTLPTFIENIRARASATAYVIEIAYPIEIAGIRYAPVVRSVCGTRKIIRGEKFSPVIDTGSAFGRHRQTVRGTGWRCDHRDRSAVRRSLRGGARRGQAI